MQIHDLRTFSVNKHLRAFGFVVFGALCAFQVSAANLAQMKNFGVSTTGNSAKVGTVNSNSNWDSVLPISPESGGWAYAGNYGIPQAAKGPTMTMSMGGDVFMAGTKYPFQAGYNVPAATLVDAIGAIAGGPIGIGLFALPFALQWLLDSGGQIDPADPTKIQRKDATVCTVAPCYNYRTSADSRTDASTPSASAMLYKQLVLDPENIPYGYTPQIDSITGSVSPFTVLYKIYNTSTGAYYAQSQKSILAISVAPQIATWLPSSMDDIAPYMMQTPFDPRVVPEILNKGGDIPFPAPTVTGPSEVLGPKTETQNPDGTKTISQPKSFFTFQGDTITNTKNETTVTVVNVDNSVSSVTTITKTPVVTDATEPVKTEDPCIKNPDRNGCRTDQFDVPEGEIPKTTKTISFEAENLGFAGGSCPSNLTQVIGNGQTITTGDWAKTCDMTVTYAKPMILIMATFAAMMIIFGFGAGRSES
jgi:hypothetical protein